MTPSQPDARLTPYELVFGPETFEAEQFPAILEEIEAREVDGSDPSRFVFLGMVGKLLRAIAGEASEAGMEPGRERAEDRAAGRDPGRDPGRSAAVEQHGRLLYHAYHFWRFGRQVLVLDADLVRRLVAGETEPGTAVAPAPHPAGYAQLPRHLVWGRADPSAPAEPLDGFFWMEVAGPADVPRLALLAVLGMRADRPGLTVVPVSEAEVGLEAELRPGGEPFGNILPGGELDALLGMETPAELSALARRLFHHVATLPETVSAERTAAAREPEPHRLPPSALPFRNVGPPVG